MRFCKSWGKSWVRSLPEKWHPSYRGANATNEQPRYCDNVVGLYVDRQKEYVKLQHPSDIPRVIQQISYRFQQLILDAGGKFALGEKAGEDMDTRLEITPLTTFWGEDVSGSFLLGW